MDPQKPESFNHRSVKLSTGRTYHFVDQLPRDYDSKLNLTLLCVHGFPDLWYGWRYQIGPWVRKGLRVVVPDMLGYGGTDKPEDPSAYTMKRLCTDLAALLDTLGIKRAVLVGHDWGAYTAGRFALWYPDRLLALVMLSVPYTPPSRRYIPIEEVAKLAPNLGYQVYFADEVSTSEIDNNLSRFLRRIFQPHLNSTALGSIRIHLGSPDLQDATEPLIINKQDFQYYCTQLKQGMNGPLNYYRTRESRHEEELAAKLQSNLRSDLPVLLLWGTSDPTTTTYLISKSRKFISRLQDVALEGRGHWLMVEAKDDVTEMVANWFEELTYKPDPQVKL